jgi:hypothetical protein
MESLWHQEKTSTAPPRTRETRQHRIFDLAILVFDVLKDSMTTWLPRLGTTLTFV